MAILNQTHDQIRQHLYQLTYLHEAERDAVFTAIQKLNANGDWYPESFQRELKLIQQNGSIQEFARQKLEREFFPEHAW